MTFVFWIIVYCSVFPLLAFWAPCSDIGLCLQLMNQYVDLTKAPDELNYFDSFFLNEHAVRSDWAEVAKHIAINNAMSIHKLACWFSQMGEMEIPRGVAERSLREHMGNVVEALIALTNWEAPLDHHSNASQPDALRMLRIQRLCPRSSPIILSDWTSIPQLTPLVFDLL